MPSSESIPRPELRVVEKPWGREEWLSVGERIVLKRLILLAGHRFSLQYHEKKEEVWLFVKGRARVRFGDAEETIGPGDVIHVPVGTIHRIEAIEDIELIEASTPELTDVVRVEDDFGRS